MRIQRDKLVGIIIKYNFDSLKLITLAVSEYKKILINMSLLSISLAFTAYENKLKFRQILNEKVESEIVIGILPDIDNYEPLKNETIIEEKEDIEEELNIVEEENIEETSTVEEIIEEEKVIEEIEPIEYEEPEELNVLEEIHLTNVNVESKIKHINIEVAVLSAGLASFVKEHPFIKGIPSDPKEYNKVFKMLLENYHQFSEELAELDDMNLDDKIDYLKEQASALSKAWDVNVPEMLFLGDAARNIYVKRINDKESYVIFNKVFIDKKFNEARRALLMDMFIACKCFDFPTTTKEGAIKYANEYGYEPKNDDFGNVKEQIIIRNLEIAMTEFYKNNPQRKEEEVITKQKSI